MDITCLGVSQAAWDSYTYAQRSQVIINSICTGATCDAEISTNTASNTASNVTVTWTNVEDVYEVSAYLDGILSGTVLFPIASYTFVGAADGNAHTYKLIPKCSNGSVGVLLNGAFTYYGCPSITAPTVSDSNVVDATCPYDLTPLVTGLPVGITAEWHNLNNTNTSSLVPDPTSVVGGIYYVFAKDSNGCYSTGTQVILTCSTETACSAPQTLLVEAITGGFRVRFQSAAYPPPSNSYTVKRRLTADPDIVGSYTTIGTPTWNATVSRWEILDNTPPLNNTLYTYRAISNCEESAPYIDYIFANITCPVVTLTPDANEIDYSFTGVGGEVDKYEVRIYDITGVTLIHTDTHLPAFPSPITGTFIYLDDGTSYKIMVRVFIDTYYKDCPFQTVTTTGNYRLNAAAGLSIDSVTGTGVPALGSTGTNGTLTGHHTAMSGSYSVVISGTVGATTKLTMYLNGLADDCVAVPVAGTYPLSVTAIEDDLIIISIELGTC